MRFIYDDGGRAAAGYKGETRDCVCRSIAIATGKPYKEVYDLINEYAKSERTGKRKTGKSSARTGVYKNTIKKVMEHYGWKWTPTMLVGKGCKVHLVENELPSGRLVVSLAKHCTAVINGVVHDTFNPNERIYVVDGIEITDTEPRCVYGYFTKA